MEREMIPSMADIEDKYNKAVETLDAESFYDNFNSALDSIRAYLKDSPFAGKDPNTSRELDALTATAFKREAHEAGVVIKERVK